MKTKTKEIKIFKNRIRLKVKDKRDTPKKAAIISPLEFARISIIILILNIKYKSVLKFLFLIFPIKSIAAKRVAEIKNITDPV
jgi:hypothetical protein